MKELSNKVVEFLNRNQWIFVFLLSALSINETFPTLYSVYIFIKDYYIIFVLLLLIWLFIRKKKKISKLAIILISIEAWWFITTLINYSVVDWDVYLYTFYDCAKAISLALIIEYYMDNPNDLVKGLLLNFELAIYSYFILFILGKLETEKITHPLLCTMILWIIPAVFIAYLHMRINRRYLRPILLISVCIFITYDVWSATSVVALAGMFGLIIFCSFIYLFNKNIKVPLWIFVLLSVLANIFVLFVFTGNAEKYPFFTFIIEKLLHKSTTFTERDVIWKEAIRRIKERPIIGYGFKPSLDVVQAAGPKTFSHCHNQILQRLFATGIIGLAQFIAFHIELVRKIDLGKNDFSRIVAMGAVFGVCITYIVEAYKKFFIFYVVFFMAYHVEELIDNCRKAKDSIPLSLINNNQRNVREQ